MGSNGPAAPELSETCLEVVRWFKPNEDGQSIDGEVCGLPVEELERFELGGTVITQMRKVRCVVGHIYHEVVAVIEDPC